MGSWPAPPPHKQGRCVWAEVIHDQGTFAHSPGFAVISQHQAFKQLVGTFQRGSLMIFLAGLLLMRGRRQVGEEGASSSESGSICQSSDISFRPNFQPP